MEEPKSVNFGVLLADYISDKEYGTVIHYQEIESVCQERRGTNRYYNYIAKAKRLLEERGKMIHGIGGGDYQIIYPGDYASAYARQVRLANGRIKHGGKIIKYAPTNDMSIGELQEYNRVSDFHTGLEARLQGDFVTVKRLVSRNHPLNPENIQK